MQRMNLSEITQSLYKDYQEAQEYISMIGKYQDHLESLGKLHELDVNTEICYQPYSGAKNYHTNKEFDKALRKVVEKHFHELSQEALDLMKDSADVALIFEKEYLQERLGMVETLERSKQ